jgi:hypothetical protein
MNTKLKALALLAGFALPSLAVAGPIYSNDFELPSTDPAADWSSTLRRDLGGPYSTFLGRFSTTTIDFKLRATEANTAGLVDQGTGGDNANRPYNITRGNVQYNRIRVPELDSGGGGGNNPGYNPSTYNGPKIDLGQAAKGGNTEPPSGDPLFTRGQYALIFDLMIFDSWDANYTNFGPDTFSVSINGEKRFEEFFDAHNLSNNFSTPELPTQNAYSPTWQDQIYRDVTLYFDVTEATNRFDIQFVGYLSQSIQDESWGLDNVRIEAMGQLRGASAPLVPAPASLALMGAGMGLMTRRKR